MAWQGYLIKIKGDTDYIIPLELFAVSSYNGAIHGQDLDSFTNTNGITIRNALENVKPKCEFNTIDSITQSQFYNYIMKPIQDRYINKDEKNVVVSFWSAEINDYIEHECYVPDVEPTIDEIDVEPIYESIRIAFISYGGKI